ncbi:MAG: hypothetical protein II811_08160 [Spirochaetaceae bacterium]|nr:hypothetical protein [Spirochaetaceae bacterium]
MTKLLLTLMLVFFSVSIPFFGQEDTNSLSEIANLLEDDTFFNRGVSRNYEKISETAKTLPLEDRQMLYNHYEEGVTPPFLMNALVGFGLGSFMQKNYINASIQAVGDTIFTIWILNSVSTLLSAKDDLEEMRQSYYGYYDNGYNYYNNNQVVVHTVRNRTLEQMLLRSAKDDYRTAIRDLTGAIIWWALFRVYECATPIFFTRSYNKKLEGSLGIYNFTDKKESIFSRASRFIQEKRPQSNTETSAEPAAESAESTEMSFSPIINPIDQSYGFSLRFALPTAKKGR